MKLKNLYYCETFYSIQGEGPTSGTPSVFLRLSGCNLECSGFSQGCDSKSLWTISKKISFLAIKNKWQKSGWLEKLNQGAHLVITGGEPLLQQDALADFLLYLHQFLSNKLYIELETNATILPKPKLFKILSQINASPKLLCSGNKTSTAYQSEVIKILNKSPKTIFKFVLCQKSDFKEVKKKFIQDLKIPQSKIWLMAEGIDQKKIQTQALWLVEIAKKELVHYSPRLQIDLWQGKIGY